jgi:hypothetical protein
MVRRSHPRAELHQRYDSAVMHRRQFLQTVALSAAAPAEAQEQAATAHGTPISEFHLDGVAWRVYEDLTTRDGAITFQSAAGVRKILTKSAEAAFAEADPPFLGLKISDVGTSGPDLLADKLLEHGDPDPEQVRLAAPPLGSGNPAGPNAGAGFASGAAGRWNAFVGTVECYDTMPVFPGGNTRTYHPNQYFPELRGQPAGLKRYEGMLGGWLPAVRKVMLLPDGAYIEMLVFGDVESKDKFIVQTWHRSAKIENGKVTKVVYGYSYPAYPPARQDPKPEEFYRALLVFANYWETHLHDLAPASLPDRVWIDFTRHAFAKELMVRPGGVYPKYGAVDRDYYGSEYDGFQDTFTMAVYANLEWGRFDQAHKTIDNYLTDFTDAKGMINMRGPETAQFGLTLSLLARYFHYTRDAALLAKHRGKIEATARLLEQMHDASLALPAAAAGHGLIAGWSESDACLAPEPDTWQQPYYANSAFAARGLKDIAAVWRELAAAGSLPGAGRLADEWARRGQTLREAVVASIRKNLRTDLNPPYVPLLPGSKLTFRESMTTERPSPQQWPHRPYAELLQADILPADLANQTIDAMRAYGATTMGVVANVGRPNPNGRAILGFISYGYALMLLRLDRIEEFLLFLHAHRHHNHTPGTWTAGEVAGITGGTAIFCIPAQQTVPLLVRWMLALEDSDEDRLYLAKGLPRDWVVAGKEIRIDQAPTRWGRINFKMSAGAAQRVTATVELARPGAPREVHVKMRLPVGNTLQSATVDGRPATIGGLHHDTVIVNTGSSKKFEVAGHYS